MTNVPRLPTIYIEKLLENSPDIVVAVDRRGTITFYNDGARGALGYASDEVLGQHVTRLYPDLGEARKVMDAMRRGHDATPGQVKNFETTFVTKGGHASRWPSPDRSSAASRARSSARSALPRICARSAVTTSSRPWGRWPSGWRMRSTTRSRSSSTA